MQLSDYDIVQPDLLIVLRARTSILTHAKVLGVPDLLVEILSPSSIGYDRKTKKQLYERCGVPEYWIVDPWEHTLEQFVLRQGKYESRTVTEAVQPEFISGVVINLREVW